MRVQDVVLHALQSFVEDRGWQWVVNPEWANTGVAYAMDGLKKVAALNYDFQNTNATIQLYPGDKTPVRTCGFTHKDCVLHKYFKYADDLEAVVDEITGKILRLSKVKPKEEEKAEKPVQYRS